MSGGTLLFFVFYIGVGAYFFIEAMAYIERQYKNIVIPTNIYWLMFFIVVLFWFPIIFCGLIKHIFKEF
jgi:hypothetical protein